MLTAAELLKLRRRRGMLLLAGALTLGIVLLVYAVTGIQHGSDPVKYGPAGGAANYRDGLGVMTLMALVVGVIVGGTAGTQDLESGVFRDLAATGRSRLALYFARVTGAWVVVLPILLVTMAVMGALAVLMAGSAAAPSASMLGFGTLGILVAGALSAAMAVGLSVLTGSRGPLIGLLLAFFLAIEPLLAAIGFLGGARGFLPTIAIERIGHMPAHNGLSVALGGAVLAVVGWTAVTLSLGAWKTRTREL